MSVSDSVVQAKPTALRAAPRLDGLDWLRAGAAVLVVALHAGMAYLIVRMPGLAWATHDPIGSPVVDGMTWWINGFIMPLFFVQSGFLACGLMRRKGPRDFLVHRSRRLLGPFALGCVLILPLDLYAWLLGWAAEGKITLHKLRSLKIDSPLGDNLWGVSHLWFLEYLWVFCVTAWAVCRVAEWLSGDGAEWQSGKVAKWQRGLWASSQWNHRSIGVVSALLLVMSGAALWWEPQILIGFRHSWWPLPANLLFFGPWFTMGWLVRSRHLAATARSEVESHSLSFESAPVRHRLPFTDLCEWRLAAAFGLFAILLPLIHQHVAATSTGLTRMTLVCLFILHAWLMVTGLFGVSLRRFNRQPPGVVKYLAEASFWIYLFHHPVVGLTQVTLSQTSLPVVAKFTVTLLSGLGLSLLTYHAFVRSTWVGALLSGRRLGIDARRESADLLPLPVPEPARLKKSA